MLINIAAERVLQILFSLNFTDVEFFGGCDFEGNARSITARLTPTEAYEFGMG